VRVALVSRELYPLRPGGIGQFVSAAASLLAEVAEVTVLTSSNVEPVYRSLRAEGDSRLPPAGVRVEFVEEPSEEEALGWSCLMHCYSARVLERLRELYPDGGPELIEFPDFLGEGFVTLQAAQALDPFLRDTRICVRIHTTRELAQILNGHLPGDARIRAERAMERYSLAHADRLIWQGGDILGAYRRFYGEAGLAPAVRIRYPYRGPRTDPAADRGREPSSVLELVCPGRLERRKGVLGLVRAACSLGRTDFRLRLVGGDTETGPLGVSVRELLELEAAGDERVVIESGGVGREQLTARVRAGDVVVIPSLWECWPYTALEALHLNRPVLATPVGGLVEMVGGEGCAGGWLAPGTGWRDLAVALEEVLDSRERLVELVGGGGLVSRASTLADGPGIVEGYTGLVAGGVRRGSNVRSRPEPEDRVPLVSAIVPYYRSARFVSQTIASLLEQTYPRLEIVLVNDGSFEEQDRVLAELATRFPIVVLSQTNTGLGAARNLGISQSRGRYFFPLDADNLAEPEFVARAVEVLETRPEIAYVTSWSRYIDEHGTPRQHGEIGYQPLGNHAHELLEEDNYAGDAAAVIRRRLFDLGHRYSEELTSFEDWHLYRELAHAGHHGTIIPQRLLRYRVHPTQMQARIAIPHRTRLQEEINAHIHENATRWTAPPVLSVSD
jgi:glycogen synthase